jgi:hypothetical protein
LTIFPPKTLKWYLPKTKPIKSCLLSLKRKIHQHLLVVYSHVCANTALVVFDHVLQALHILRQGCQH